ncbi:hypothetical protein [Candidatus Palauibacter sp.]|uniref:hypothetical protein n=1 Tax=Candidatus Palauibacter sp. TaxID=3101350 RepID=UPI003B021638
MPQTPEGELRRGGPHLALSPVSRCGRSIRIAFSGPEGVAVLDGASDVPMALVTDRTTGRITAILRGEDAVRGAATSLAGAVGSAPPTDVLLSYGLPGRKPK